MQKKNYPQSKVPNDKSGLQAVDQSNDFNLECLTIQKQNAFQIKKPAKLSEINPKLKPPDNPISNAANRSTKCSKNFEIKTIKKDLKINGYLFINKFKFISKLDSGGFGTVYKAEKNGETFAVKVIRINTSEKSLDLDLKREISILIQVEHENIVRCYDIMRTAHRVYIFMEFASGGTLGKYVRKYGPLPVSINDVIKSYEIYFQIYLNI